MVYAAIDIGSNHVDLKIVSYDGAEILSVDEMSSPVRIGQEVYSGEYISSESVAELVRILLRYRQLLRDYKVDYSRVIATGALGNSKNSAQVREIIRMKTGFVIDILEGPVENYTTYKALRDRYPYFEKIRQGAVIVDAHSGSTDITIYSKGKLITNDTIKMGIQIAVPYIEKLMSLSGEYPSIMRDYVSTLTRRALKKILNRNTDYLVLIGPGATELSDVFFDGRREIGDRDMNEILERVLSKDYELEKKAGDRWIPLLFLMILYSLFLDAAGAVRIIFPEISLSDGIIAAQIEESLPEDRRYALFEDDIFDAASEVARRFKCKLRHIRNVEANSLCIFDHLRTLCDFSDEDRFVLRLAAHIVEIGKALKRSGYERATFDMLHHLDIFGVSRATLKLIAHIALEMENIFSVEPNRAVHSIRTRKIAVILAAGMALDITNLQHLKVEDVVIGGEEIRLELDGIDIASTRIAIEKVQKAFMDCLGYKLTV